MKAWEQSSTYLLLDESLSYWSYWDSVQNVNLIWNNDNHSVKKKNCSVDNLKNPCKVQASAKKLKTFQYYWVTNKLGKADPNSGRLGNWGSRAVVGIDLFCDKKHSFGNETAKLCSLRVLVPTSLTHHW